MEMLKLEVSKYSRVSKLLAVEVRYEFNLQDGDLEEINVSYRRSRPEGENNPQFHKEDDVHPDNVPDNVIRRAAEELDKYSKAVHSYVEEIDD